MVHANYAVTRQTYDSFPARAVVRHCRRDFGLLYHPGELFEEASGMHVSS